MSSIEHYLHVKFERRAIKELAGTYKGPKKVKTSGKAAGTKKEKRSTKTTAVTPKPKQRLRDRKQIGNRRVPTGKNKEKSFDSAQESGFQPLKKKPTGPADS
jgi:hypothetical protein